MRRWWIRYSLGLRLCVLGVSHADERRRHPSRRAQSGLRALALGRLTAMSGGMGSGLTASPSTSRASAKYAVYVLGRGTRIVIPVARKAPPPSPTTDKA
jgi:hypothetical protein